MSSVARKPLQGNQVLIAEDNPVLAFYLSKTLCDAGADVVGPVMTLEDAKSLAASAECDCGVLDVSFRGHPIFPVAEILRQRRIAIIFFTGYADTGALQRDWPEAQVVVKPASRVQLIRAVSAACGLL